MEIQSIHELTRWWLFKFADKIQRKRDVYRIEYDPDIGYMITYRSLRNPDAIYKVIKGRDENGFQFNLCLKDEQRPVFLAPGNILLFESDFEDRVCFTCTTMTFQGIFADPSHSYGMTDYGSLSAMLAEGLIEKAHVL
jgi:hypothetical protein